EAELELLARYDAGFDAERLETSQMTAALSQTDALAIRQIVDGVRVSPEVRVYIADITRSTREERMLSLGASPRATVALFRAARAAVDAAGASLAPRDRARGARDRGRARYRAAALRAGSRRRSDARADGRRGRRDGAPLSRDIGVGAAARRVAPRRASRDTSLWRRGHRRAP